MKTIITKIRQFHTQQHGTTSVEYAIMLALIASVCILGIISVGQGSGNFWEGNSTQIAAALGN